MGEWPGEEKLRRARVQRGDVRAAALALLAEEPRNGYQVIQEIAERSGGVWQPSPGSVYPALQQLEDEGLIGAETADNGRKAFALTDEASPAFIHASGCAVDTACSVDGARPEPNLTGRFLARGVQHVAAGAPGVRGW